MQLGAEVAGVCANLKRKGIMRSLKVASSRFLVVLVFLLSAGCGGGGGSAGTGSNKTALTTVKDASPVIEKVSGNAQVIPMGAASSEPLVVRLSDPEGNPLADEAVTFYVKGGSADFDGESMVSVATGSDGTASASVNAGAGLARITVRAEFAGAGSVVFNLSPRLPTLGEIAHGSKDDLNIDGLPAMLADVEGTGRTLVLLTGEGDLDLAGLPVAGDLFGTEVGGVQAGDLPVVLMPARRLVDSASFSPPAAGSLPGNFVAGEKAENLPAVLPDYTVNSEKVVMLVKGDASSIPGAVSLADLLAASSTASDLTVRVIEASDYPDVQTAFADYIALDEATLPVFDGFEEVTGAPGSFSLPVADVTIPAGDLSLVDLDGCVTPGVKLEPVENPVKKYAPEGTLTSIPPEYREVVSIVQEQIVPLSQGIAPVMEEQAALLDELWQTLGDHPDTMAGFFNGDLNDIWDAADLLGELMPVLDEMLRNQLEILPVQAEQLGIIRDRLLPSVEAALEDNDVVFGGASDGEPTSVLNHVLPFIDGELALLQESMPLVGNLLADMESLVPDDGNLLGLIWNGVSGGVDAILADLETLLPNVVSGLRLFNDDGIPILYDLLEQAEADIQPGDVQVSDMSAFEAVVGWMSSELSADAALGDLPGFDWWGPMAADYLPPEWGDPAGVSIFDDIVPAVGGMDIAEEVLPALRIGLDALAGGLPGVISALEDFSFPDLSSFLVFS